MKLFTKEKEKGHCCGGGDLNIFNPTEIIGSLKSDVEALQKENAGLRDAAQKKKFRIVYEALNSSVGWVIVGSNTGAGGSGGSSISSQFASERYRVEKFFNGQWNLICLTRSEDEARGIIKRLKSFPKEIE